MKSPLFLKELKSLPGKLLQFCLAKGLVFIQGKLLQKMEDFDMLYREYHSTFIAKTRNGIVRSWFELYRRYKKDHLIMINTFGVDSRKVLAETHLSGGGLDNQMFNSQGPSMGP